MFPSSILAYFIYISARLVVSSSSSSFLSLDKNLTEKPNSTTKLSLQMKSPWFLLLLLAHVDLIVGWEAYELDLFDLVEEIGLSTNFYEFLGVEKTAETSEIKKAYR